MQTTDKKAAEAFYDAILGWQCKDSGMPMDYSFIKTAGTVIGGVMTLPDDTRRAGGGDGPTGQRGRSSRRRRGRP